MILGDAFEELRANVKVAHLAPLDAIGELDVEHGNSWLTPLLVKLLKLPAKGRNQHVDLRLESCPRGRGILWSRRIGNSPLKTRQVARGPFLIERSGVGSVVFELSCANGALMYRQVSAMIFGIPLPRAFSPHVDASVEATPSGWKVAVTINWRNQLICRYWGELRKK